MNLMPFADLLEIANLGVKGQSIFLNMMPAEAESAILLRGPLSGTPINYELTNYFRTEIQVIVRSNSYPDGEALIGQVMGALTLQEVAVDTACYVKQCRPRAEAAAFPLSRGNLIEFNVMFDIVFVRMT